MPPCQPRCWSAAGSANAAPATGTAFPAQFSAPYVQIDSRDTGDLTADLKASGQLQSVYGESSSAAWGQLGLTPIAGKNDENENFTRQNAATTLESFAAARGVDELAFWEVDQYDRPLGHAYSKIFEKITN